MRHEGLGTDERTGVDGLDRPPVAGRGTAAPRGGRARWAVALVGSAALCWALSALPAAASATVAGRVTDETGAIIMGASVRAVHLATNDVRTTVTTDKGLYVVAELAPGRYRLEVTSAGFRTEAREVVLNVDASLNVDFRLRVGEYAESVEVAAEAASLVQRHTGQVGTLVDRQFVENLPLNGRSFQTLLELTPGLVLVPTAATQAGQFTVNGQRPTANYFTVDGVSANVGVSLTAQSAQQASGSLPGLTVTGGTNSLVSVDALEEFRVLTSSFAPQYGRSPGAQISVVTRSGSNRPTASIFEYVRNEAFDANDWFNNAKGIRKLPLRQHQFGGVFGGPIVLPGYDGRDRAFFFASYEGLRLTQPQPQLRSYRVPTPEARGQAAGGIREVLNAFPLPNAPALAADPPFTARYESIVSLPSAFDAYSLRLDQRPSGAVRLFGRVAHTPSNSRNRSYANIEGLYDATTTTATAGATWTPGPRLVVDVRGNYSQSEGRNEFRPLAIDGAVLPSDALLFPSFATRDNTMVIVNLVSASPQTYLQLGRNVRNVQRQINLIGDLTWVRGTHEVKAGGDYRRLSPDTGIRAYSINYNFNTVANALTLGAPQTIGVSAQAGASTYYLHNVSGFLQDVWRATPRLTLTYGARYDVNPPPAGDKLPFTLLGLDAPLGATLAPEGTKQWKTTWANVAPRVGVSYVLGEERGVVLRGGFGVFYDLGTGTALRGYNGFPYNASRTVSGLTGFPVPASLIQPPAFNTTPPYAGTFYVADENLKLPYTLQWNVAAEKPLGAHQSVSVTYLGARARRLLRTNIYQNRIAIPVVNLPELVMLNPSLFGFGTFVYYTKNDAESSYDSLQVQYQRRMTRGLQAMASYTLGYARDNASAEAASQIPGGGVPNFPVDPKREFGPSDYDVRHTVTGTLTWDVPAPRPPALRALFGHWGLDLFGRVRSGAPLQIISQAFDPLNVATTRRPDLVPGQPVWIDVAGVPGGRRLNPQAFVEAAFGTQGNLERNSIRGFGAWQVDMALRRTFRVAPDVRLQVRAEAFNLFNHVNFSGIYSTIGMPEFGLASSTLGRTLGGGTGTGLASLYAVGGPRSLQFSLKLLFW